MLMVSFGWVYSGGPHHVSLWYTEYVRTHLAPVMIALMHGLSGRARAANDS